MDVHGRGGPRSPTGSPREVFERLLGDGAVRGPLRRRALGAAGGRARALARRDVPAPTSGVEVRGDRAAAPVWVDGGATVRDGRAGDARGARAAVLVRGRPARHRHRARLPRPRARRGARARDAESPAIVDARRARRVERAARRIHEAWTALLDAGGHHLPVAAGRRDGRVVGSTELLRWAAQGPIAVLRAVAGLALARRPAGPRRAGGRDRRGAPRGGPRGAPDRRVRRAARRRARRAHRPARRGGPRPGARAGGPGSRSARRAAASGRSRPTRTTRSSSPRGRDARGWYAALARARERRSRGGRVPALPGRLPRAGWNGPLGEWARRFGGWIDAPSPGGAP